MKIQKLYVFLCLLYLISWAGISEAQTSWTAREDLNALLPSSIQVYELDNPTIPLRAWCVIADTRDSQWKVQTLLSEDSDGKENVSQFAARTNALVAINAGYFAIVQGKAISVSLVTIDGKVLASNSPSVNKNNITYYPTRSAFSLLSNGTFDISWIYEVDGIQYAYPEPSPIRMSIPQPKPNAFFPSGGFPWPSVCAIGGGPILVQEGRVRVTWEEEVLFWSSTVPPQERHPRTAIGYTSDNRIIFLVVDGRQTASRGVSLHELAEMMVELGTIEAMNLDGGGSSTLVIKQKLINRPEGGTYQREVVSAVAIIPKEN